MPMKLTNDAVSTLAAAIAATDTVISIVVGDAGRFPALAEGDWFPLTIVDAGSNTEIVRVTARASGTLTVVRAQEGTTAKDFAAGARVDIRMTAGAVNEIYNRAAAGVPLEGAATKNGRLTVGNVAATNAKNAMAPQVLIGNQAGGATDDTNVAALGLICHGNYMTSINLRADGTLGFGGGSADPYRAYLNMGNGDFTAAGDVSAYSDPRLKDDIERVVNPLDIVRALDGVFFTWNGKTTLIGKPGQRDIGLLADQVRRVLPEAAGLSVKDPENGDTEWMTVYYSKLVPVLVEAVKALDAKIQQLEGRSDS